MAVFSVFSEYFNYSYSFDFLNQKPFLPSPFISRSYNVEPFRDSVIFLSLLENYSDSFHSLQTSAFLIGAGDALDLSDAGSQIEKLVFYVVSTRYSGSGESRVVDYRNYSSHFTIEDINIPLSEYFVAASQSDSVQLSNLIELCLSGDDEVYLSTDGDTMYTFGGNDYIYTYGGDDTIYAGDGDDTIDASVLSGEENGYAEFYGGPGNDTYIISGPYTMIYEYAGEGSDTLYIADPRAGRVFNMALNAANVEDVALSNSVRYNVTGNAEGNRITGNNAVNTLAGKGGDDFLIGLGGNDTLTGGDGNDVLDGGGGADKMQGGPGDDIYWVDNTQDRVYETTTTLNATDAGGSDRIYSSVSFDLSAYIGVRFVENLTLMGTVSINGTGNALDNNIIGNSVNNRLIGGDGNDNLVGNGGSDVLDGGDGFDYANYGTATSTVTVSLAVNGSQNTGAHGTDTLISIEGLIGGYGNDRLTGNAGDNVLFGGDGNDILVGGAGADRISGGLGNDTLTGGAGADTFIFSYGPNVTANKETITDFLSGTDTLQFSISAFSGLDVGVLNPEAFCSGSGLTSARDSTDRFIYNSASGYMYFDQDGVGGSPSIQIAVFSNKPLISNFDLVIG